MFWLEANPSATLTSYRGLWQSGGWTRWSARPLPELIIIVGITPSVRWSHCFSIHCNSRWTCAHTHKHSPSREEARNRIQLQTWIRSLLIQSRLLAKYLCSLAKQSLSKSIYSVPPRLFMNKISSEDIFMLRPPEKKREEYYTSGGKIIIHCNKELKQHLSCLIWAPVF